MLVEIPKTPIEELKTPFLEFQKIRIFIKGMTSMIPF